MWTEKYRPKNLDDMVNQTDIISRLKNFVKEKAMPNLLFVGPAGIGKSTSILALARERPDSVEGKPQRHQPHHNDQAQNRQLCHDFFAHV